MSHLDRTLPRVLCYLKLLEATEAREDACAPKDMTKITRWTARTISTLVLLFWGFIIVGHLTGDANQDARPLMTADYIILVSLSASLLGLLIAWRYEFAGAALTLVSISVCAFVNWRVMIFPGTLIPLAALLFLIAWWTSKQTFYGSESSSDFSK